ncbi:unnamed protein product, partial [Dibothriocephalus latus]
MTSVAHGLLANTSVSLPPPPSSTNAALSLPVNLKIPLVDNRGLFGTVTEPSHDEAEEEFLTDVGKETSGPPVANAVRREPSHSPRNSGSPPVSFFEPDSLSPPPQVLRRGRKRKHRCSSVHHPTTPSSTPSPTPVRQQEKVENFQCSDPPVTSSVAAFDLLASVRPINLLPDIPLPVCTSFGVGDLAGATQGSFARFVNSTGLPSFSELGTSECIFSNKTAARQCSSVTESKPPSRCEQKENSQGTETDTPTTAAFDSSDSQNPESISSCRSSASSQPTPLLPDSIKLSFATELFKPVFADPLKPSPLTLPFTSANEKDSTVVVSACAAQQPPITPIKSEATFTLSSCGVFSSLTSFGTAGALCPMEQYVSAGFSRPAPGMTFGSFAGAAAFRSESFSVLAAKARQSESNPPHASSKSLTSGSTAFEAGVVTRPATFSDIAKIARETSTEGGKLDKDKNAVLSDISSSSNASILQASPLTSSSFAFGKNLYAPTTDARPFSSPLNDSSERSLCEVSSSGNEFTVPPNEPLGPTAWGEPKTHSDNALRKGSKSVGRTFRRRGRHNRRRQRPPNATPSDPAVLSIPANEDTEVDAVVDGQPIPPDNSLLAPSGLEVANNSDEPVPGDAEARFVGVDAIKASKESVDKEDVRSQISTSPESKPEGAGDSDFMSSHIFTEATSQRNPVDQPEPQRLPIRLKLKLTPVSTTKPSPATTVSGGGGRIGKLRLRLRDPLGRKKSKT